MANKEARRASGGGGLNPFYHTPKAVSRKVFLSGADIGDSAGSVRMKSLSSSKKGLGGTQGVGGGISPHPPRKPGSLPNTPRGSLKISLTGVSPKNWLEAGRASSKSGGERLENLNLVLPDLSAVGMGDDGAHPTALPPNSLPAAQAVEAALPKLRSSEMDPAAYQVEVPPVDDFLLAARSCSVLDSYRVVDQSFDFGLLVGRSRIALEGFATAGASGVSGSVEGEGLVAPLSDGVIAGNGGDENKDGAALLPIVHHPIVRSILDCADDVVVEGFFHERGGGSAVSARGPPQGAGGSMKKVRDDTGAALDKGTDNRSEAAVFFSRRRRQFLCVWRGTSADQAKPVRNRHMRAWKESPKITSEKNFHPDQPVTAFPPFRDVYFGSGMEERVFSLLDSLCDRNTFCDIIMTGHSFGAAMALIAAARFASSRPMLRVMCQAFGCPRVGAVNFRHLVNSLPNIKVSSRYWEYRCAMRRGTISVNIFFPTPCLNS